MSYTNSKASIEAKRANMAACNAITRERNKERSAARKANKGAYSSWAAMKTRCTNPNHNRFPLYGGRGITFDPRWDDFLLFLEDMGPRPDRHSIDRIDPDGNYCKENCRWADYSTQNSNRRILE